MKSLIVLKSSLILIIGILSCDKKKDDKNCYAAKILEVSCGGTVLQFISSDNIGEEWKDVTSNSTVYSNCVLAGNVPAKLQNAGDTLFFSYKKVTFFSAGNFCDIGGLPNTKIEIENFFNNNCLKTN